MRAFFVGAVMLGGVAVMGMVQPPIAGTSGAEAATGSRSARFSDSTDDLLVNIVSLARPGTIVTVATSGGTVRLLRDSAHVASLRIRVPASVLVDSAVRELHISTSDETPLKVTFYRDGALVPPAPANGRARDTPAQPSRDTNWITPSQAWWMPPNDIQGRDLYLARAGRSFRVLVKMYQVAP